MPLQVSTTSTGTATYIEQNGTGNGLQVTSSGSSGTSFIFKARSTGVDRFWIGDTGNVGIGITNPGAKLQVKTSTSAGATDAFYIENTSLALFGVRDDGLIYMRGNVGIGTSSPTFALDVASTSADTFRINRTGVAGTGSASSMSFQVTQSNLQSATLGSISAEFMSNWGGDLRFYTKPANGTPNDSVTERMRITSGGFTKISNNGTYINSTSTFHEISTSITNNNIAYLSNTAASPYGPYIYFPNAAPNNTTNYFLQCADSTVNCFTIWSNGTTSGRSDIRLKKNVVDATPKLDKLMQLRLVNYEWKESIDGGKELGLIAQEVEEIFPNLVITEPIKKKREIEQEDGTIIEEEYIDGDSKSIKNSVLPYITIKALQELTTLVQEQQAQIEELNQKVNALENK
jgi:hypothetical protein